MHTQRQWHKDKRYLLSVLSKWKIWPIMCHTVITQTVKSSLFHFFHFYSPFHQMYVKCRYKALILVRKSVQPFIINSHLNSFSFRLLFFFFLFFAYVPSLLRDRKSVRRIKRSRGWREFVWWVMRWTNLRKGEKYFCQVSSPVSRGLKCLRHSLSCCWLLPECCVRDNFACKFCT